MAEPDYLNIFVRLFAVRNEYDTLFDVGFNTFTAQLIKQISPAFLCLATRC